MTASPAQRKLFAVAKEMAFTDDERHDLAEIVLRRDIRSWAELTDDDVKRLLDTICGWGIIQHLIDTRAPDARPRSSVALAVA